VVGVVGLGHLKGIVSHWEDEIDRAKLLTIPAPQASSKLFRNIAIGTVAVAVSCVAIAVKYFLF